MKIFHGTAVKKSTLLVFIRQKLEKKIKHFVRKLHVFSSVILTPTKKQGKFELLHRFSAVHFFQILFHLPFFKLLFDIKDFITHLKGVVQKSCIFRMNRGHLSIIFLEINFTSQ